MKAWDELPAGSLFIYKSRGWFWLLYEALEVALGHNTYMQLLHKAAFVSLLDGIWIPGASIPITFYDL
jgi:hypothetical protein